MGKGSVKSGDPCCKFCKNSFSSPNPMVKNAAPDDCLKHRTPGSHECRPCFQFKSSHEDYQNLSSSALFEVLRDPQNQADFNAKREAWCEHRRQGKRKTAGGCGWGIGVQYSNTDTRSGSRDRVVLLLVIDVKVHEKWEELYGF